MADRGSKTPNERRVLRATLIAIVALAVLAASSYYLALHTLKAQVVRLLGTQSEYTSLQVSLTSIVIENLRIRVDAEADSAKDWPADDELRAARVQFEPDLRSLLTRDVLIRHMTFERAHLPVMRGDGRLRFLPSLLENRRKQREAKGEVEGSPPKKYVHIAHVDIVDSDIDFYDATISRKPYRIPFHRVKGQLGQLKFPTLDEEATVDLEAVTEDHGHAGSISLQGRVVPHTRDSQLTLKMRGVDLRQLQPYFVKTARTQIEDGTLDVDVTSTVRDHVLNAPGTLVLHNLKTEGGLGLGELNRKIALALLKDRHDRIELQFTLAGNLSDPKFSLNEELYVRVVSALARSLGVSIEGLGKGVLDIGESIGEGIGTLLHDVVE